MVEDALNYGVEKSVQACNSSAIIDAAVVRCEFLSFKLQGNIEWQDKPFLELWSLISWNLALQFQYSNLFAVADIICVQCVRTA